MWSRDNIKRIITDFYLKVTSTPFTGDGSHYTKGDVHWQDDLGLDSIELMELAAYVNSFFCLFYVDDAPYLLSLTTTGQWVEAVFNARQKADENLVFNTSGTSGNTKSITHAVAFIQREVNHLATLFANATHIIPYVPSYTIYGFLCTVGLPAKLGIPVLYPSALHWKELPPGALIVATPFNWQLLVHSLPQNITGCLGVCAAAPLHNNIFKQVTAKNILLTELYGSTETAGVGSRQHWQQAFTFFPYWQCVTHNGSLALADRSNNLLYPLMDDIALTENEGFVVLGRKDKQVKIAGKLVDPQLVEAAILQIPNVQHCTITAKATEGTVKMHATIKLTTDGEDERRAVRTQVRQTLAPHERPWHIEFTENM